MIKATVEDIEKHVKEYIDKGTNWHFHILTPECQLNDVRNYVLILENTGDDTVYVCYSSKPYMDVGKELVQLLHGSDVMKDKNENKKIPASAQVNKLLNRAKTLNAQGKFWHHHMLFPYCKYNKNRGKWTIIFEDYENNEVIESISDDEPTGDLQHVEALFYSQKKKK